MSNKVNFRFMNDIWTEISVLLSISYEITLKSYFFLFKIFLEIILFIISSSFPQNTIHNYANIGIGIGSVSADMKKRISVIYRIGQFGEWHLSVFIGIGRYEKKLIGRTLTIVVGLNLKIENFHIGILSVSAAKKIEFIWLYRYRPIWKKAYWS